MWPEYAHAAGAREAGLGRRKRSGLGMGTQERNRTGTLRGGGARRWQQTSALRPTARMQGLKRPIGNYTLNQV